jgi:hypothetical protein
MMTYLVGLSAVSFGPMTLIIGSSAVEPVM